MGDEVLQKGIPASDSGWENVEIVLMWSLLNCIYFVSPVMFVYWLCKYKFLEGYKQLLSSWELFWRLFMSKSWALCLFYPVSLQTEGARLCRSGSLRSSVSECLRPFSHVVPFGSPSQKPACHFQKMCFLTVHFCVCKTRKGHACQFLCVPSSGKAELSLPSRSRKSVMLLSCVIEGRVLQFYNRTKTSSIVASKK